VWPYRGKLPILGKPGDNRELGAGRCGNQISLCAYMLRVRNTPEPGKVGTETPRQLPDEEFLPQLTGLSLTERNLTVTKR
jgi:hypothetical protein